MSEMVETWQRLLPSLRERFIGGQSEDHATPEGTFRGPIDEITIEGDTLVISGSWCAHLVEDGWVSWHITKGTYTLEHCSEPQEIGEGRMSFTYPFSLIVLYPKDGPKLDPSRVRGLQVA